MTEGRTETAIRNDRGLLMEVAVLGHAHQHPAYPLPLLRALS